MASEPLPERDPAADTTDDELMARLAAGSESALDELSARHRGRLVRLATRALGDRGQAEDVVQETFLRVFRHASTYRPQGHFSSWLLTIASRLCLNASRNRARRLELPLASSPALASPASPERSLELRQLREALGRLPHRHRLALILKAVEGLSYREIARALECSETDVANAVFRARKALAKELGSRPAR
jgi:RNA polymerase sigma-70 factor (ECF subfamily)